MAKRNAATDNTRRSSRTSGPRGTRGATTRIGALRSPSSAISRQATRSTTRSGVRRPSERFPEAVTSAVKAALDKKAEDVVVLDLRKAGGFTDFFVICTGRNPRQITAVADGVRDTLKRDLGERPTLTEGIDRSEWILLDYFNFVVHVFSPECRAFYGLERLWGNAERHEIADDSVLRV